MHTTGWGCLSPDYLAEEDIEYYEQKRRTEEILADAQRLHDAVDKFGNWREYDQLISRLATARPGELNQAATYLRGYLERIAIEAAKAEEN